MISQSLPTRRTDGYDFAALLFTASSTAARAGLVGATVVSQFPNCACILYRFVDGSSDAAWRSLGFAGEVSLEQVTLPSASPLLAPLLTGPEAAVTYSGAELRREDFAHLHVTRSVASICCLRLMTDGILFGATEILSFADALTPEDIEGLQPLLDIAAVALLRAEESEREKEHLLDSVYRLTQLYDLEKSLNATLDLDHVTALIPRKVLDILKCEAVHLWLFDGDVLTLKSTSGADATVYVGMTQQAGEGYVGDAAEEGETLLIADPSDERLTLRNKESETPVWTAMVVPLMQDEAEVGVLEAVNKVRENSSAAFDEDDEFFLTTIAETVSSALKNASLMYAERKLAILETLVHVSSEITSTLRLDRLLQIIVNSPQNVLPFERCAIALDTRGKLQLKAVSGLAHLPIGEARVEMLQGLVRWLSQQPEAIHLRLHEGDASEQLPQEVASYFEATGYRALYALPLNDDQGRVGMLLYESSDPDFLDLPHTEMIKILAGQATVAIRNALLYREVPLISLLEPLMQRKQALLRTTRGRLLGFGLGAAAAALFLIFCPLPMRLTGVATIAPEHLVTVAAPVAGTVATVYVHEGQRVHAGQALASMNDLQWRTELTAAEARYRAAELTMEADLARGSAQAGEDRAQVEFLQAEAMRARNRIDNATMRSPIDGIVMTSSLEDAAGERLDAGAAFAQILDLRSAVVDVAIPQSEASLLEPGQTVSIKLNSYPQRSWHGAVDIVSPEAEPGDGVRTFAARVPLANADAALRTGMSGRGKIFIGYRPAGYVLLRGPALWAWQTLWNWFGW
jgi:RND family efflux transporter MFP subunit